jgi:hypothetical protein
MVFEILGHFLFKRGQDHCMVMTYITSDAPYHKKQAYERFRGGDLNGF